MWEGAGKAWPMEPNLPRESEREGGTGSDLRTRHGGAERPWCFRAGWALVQDRQAGGQSGGRQPCTGEDLPAAALVCPAICSQVLWGVWVHSAIPCTGLISSESDVPVQAQGEALTLNAMVTGGRTLGRSLGFDEALGWGPHDEVSALVEETPGSMPPAPSSI